LIAEFAIDVSSPARKPSFELCSMKSVMSWSLLLNDSPTVRWSQASCWSDQVVESNAHRRDPCGLHRLGPARDLLGLVVHDLALALGLLDPIFQDVPEHDESSPALEDRVELGKNGVVARTELSVAIEHQV
jgi:hypothetical protein